MKFSAAVRKILSSAADPMTPKEIQNHIKIKYPQLYGTPSHIRNVKKGHYKDIDHALLAQIYSFVRTSDTFFCDKNFKPMKISLIEADKQIRQRNTLSRRAFKPKPHTKRKKGYEDRVRDILANSEKYHLAYYEAVTFRGPSLYFYQRALETRQEPVSLTHLEYVYATLVSWGMHRMGGGGSKMQSFDIFRRSIERLQDRIVEAQNFDFREMTGQNYALLEEIFRGINVMASRSSLVGNSKVMHNILPNIVPPIDRNYTLLYLRGNTNIKNDLDYEWQLMKGIISDFFIPVASDAKFRSKTSKWMTQKDKYPWDTSILKIVDNLVIGSRK